MAQIAAGLAAAHRLGIVAVTSNRATYSTIESLINA